MQNQIYKIKGANGSIMTIDLSTGESISLIDNQGHERLFQGKAKSKAGEPTIWSGTAPRLFPYISDGGKSPKIIDGVSYDFSGRHGFLRSGADFKVVPQKNDSENSVTIRYDVPQEKYPCKCAYEVTYTMTEHGYDETTRVINLDTKPLSFACGTHTAIKLDKPLSDFIVQIESAESNEKQTYFASECMDNAMIIENNQNRTATVMLNENGKLTPIQKINKPAHDICLWSKEGFVCVETFCGKHAALPLLDQVAEAENRELTYDDMLNIKSNITVEPDQTFEVTENITLMELPQSLIKIADTEQLPPSA